MIVIAIISLIILYKPSDPTDPDAALIKRVIALEGDRVRWVMIWFQIDTTVSVFTLLPKHWHLGTAYNKG